MLAICIAQTANLSGTKQGYQVELTKLCVGEVSPVGEVSRAVPVHQFAAARLGIGGAGFGHRLDKMLVVSVSPAPPADLRLPTARNDRPVVLVPAWKQKPTQHHC